MNIKLVRLSPKGKQYYEPGAEDIKQGVLIVGQPGSGQDRLLLSMLAQELLSGQSFSLLDFHGKFLPELLEYAHSNQGNRIAYLDFADRQFPINYNLLEKTPPEGRVLVKESLLVALKTLFGDSWGPRMEYILAYTIMALLEARGTTLFSIQEFLVDERYRNGILKQVRDPFVRYFFTTEFSAWSNRFRQEAIAPIQNKIGQFLLDPLLRNLVCQTKNEVPISTGDGKQKIILARLPCSQLGTTACRLLGSILLVRLLQSTTRSQESAATPRSLYLPEIQTMDAPGLASILEQASDSGLQLVVSTPSLFTLTEPLRKTLVTHLRMILAFRLGPDDAEWLDKEATPHYRYENFINLGPNQIVFRPFKWGYPDIAYRLGYVPPLPPKPKISQREKIANASRQRYASPREVLAAKFERHLAKAIDQFNQNQA